MIGLLVGASVAFCLLMTPALIVAHYDAKRAQEAADAAAHHRHGAQPKKM